jgi:hypothetical protein
MHRKCIEEIVVADAAIYLMQPYSGYHFDSLFFAYRYGLKIEKTSYKSWLY